MRMHNLRLLVNPDPMEDKIGNIHLPDKAKDKPISGIVVALDPQITNLRIGQRVFYPSYAPLEWKKQIILNYTDIIMSEDSDETNSSTPSN